MASIKHLFHIDAAPEKIFKALTTIEGLQNWWTAQTSGDTKPGGIIQFRFGQFGNDMKVKELKPTELLVWECAGGPPDWTGTTVSFKLDSNEGKTRVRFSHDGWKETEDMYAICSFSWARYLESLRQYCQTGKGEAFGSEGYRM